MSFLPVALRLLAVCTVLGLSAQAYARTEVRGMRDIVYENGLREVKDKFDMMVVSSIFYQQCSQTWGITDEQKEYQKGMYDRASKAYADMLYNTYQEKAGVPPSQKVVDYYTRYLANEQQEEINAAIRAISTNRGCNETVVKMNYRRTEQMHQQELLDAKAEKLKERRYDPWKQPTSTTPIQPDPNLIQPPAPPAATPQPTQPAE